MNLSTDKLIDFEEDTDESESVLLEEKQTKKADVEEVPVHLFLSPKHNRASSSSSNETQRRRRRIKETTFVEIENNNPGNVENEEFSSARTSPITVSSGTDEIISPRRLSKNIVRKNNKIHDALQLQTKSMASEHRRRSGGDAIRESEAGRSATSMSDYSTYRDRLKDHINTMKERAAESVSRPQSRQSRAQSRMRVMMASRLQRTEETLKREEREVALALERHQKMRSQWQQLSHELMEKKAEKDSYEFFTMQAEEDAVGVAPEEPVSPAITIKSRDERPTAADCLNLLPVDDPVVWQPAVLAPDITDQYNKLLFCPSNKPLKFEDKLEEGLNARFMEEEGLYVGDKENRPRRNKLEHRLLNIPGGKKWFGPDGELKGKVSEVEHSLAIAECPDIGDRVEYRLPVLAASHRALDDKLVVLDVEVLSVRYTHHSLFSKEHVLSQRLWDLWRVMRQLRHTDSCRRLKGQLDALRRARASCEGPELNKVNTQINQVRYKWLAECSLEKQVQNRLQDTWRDLQRMREEQGYRNTGISLIAKQKPGLSLEEWEGELNSEIAETLEEEQLDYDIKIAKYEQELQLWREKVKLAKSNSETEESNDDIELKEEVEAPEPIEAPQSIAPIDRSAIEHQVRDKFKECLRNPAEPYIEFTLGDLGPPTACSDNKEEARRSAQKKQTISVKLMCNGKEVYRSESESLSQKFTVRYGERFAVRLLEWPKQLSLLVCECGRPQSTVYLPIPDRLSTVERADVEWVEFSSAAEVVHSHAGVGSGRDMVPCPGGSKHNSRPVCMYTSGVVSCRLGWAVDDAGRSMAPPPAFWAKLRSSKPTALSTKPHSEVSKLREWVDKAQLDPNDPANAQLLKDLEQQTAHSEAMPPLGNELDFCDESEITNNPRLRLLRLRDQGEPEFQGYQMVPLCEKLIHPDTFKAYEARIAKPVESEALTDPVDSHRAVGRRQMEQIRQEIMQRCRQSRHHRRLADVVVEDQVPDLSTLGLALMRWLQPKRPLRPERKQRKKVTVQNLVGQDVNIIVNVVRAFEIPVRKDMDTLAPSDAIDGFSFVNVRPYVSATFRGETVRTTAADGANPTWNQDLILPVRTSGGDFSPGVLAGIKDVLYLHLFDEVVIDLIEDEEARETFVHQRLERHWLASLEIPFSTLYCNSRVEGTFQMYSPPVLLGYERQAHRLTVGALPQRDATYLTVFITVQPSLNPPEPFLDIFSTTESPAMEKHLRGWQAEMQSLFPTRMVSPLVSTASGAAVCVTRFIKPLAPLTIPELEDEPITPAAVARFVSRIPTMSSATFYTGLLHVWLTSEQLLNMLVGNVEDHAVALCCMLLHMGLPAYLLLGVGIPHGASAYVLVNTPGNEVVWEPTSGTKYTLRDSFCPLQRVFCLVNNSNIWGNIQDDDHLRRTRFDVTKRSDWLPAFNKNFAPPTDSIQPENLTYRETSKQAVAAFQEKLEQRLREGVMKWRPRQRTQWNRYCAATMRKLLPQLETATWRRGDAPSPDHWQGLHNILASHKVCGFPINMGYTDIATVMEAVKATGIHTNEAEDAEFALAAYIYPYPCDVLSVWVYIAALIRRR